MITKYEKWELWNQILNMLRLLKDEPLRPASDNPYKVKRKGLTNDEDNHELLFTQEQTPYPQKVRTQHCKIS